jgi:hypothetical protein
MKEESTRASISSPSVIPNAKRIAVIGAGACGLCAAFASQIYELMDNSQMSANGMDRLLPPAG